MTNASHPRGRRKPPSSSSASACREKPHAGGYRRMRFVNDHARVGQAREIGGTRAGVRRAPRRSLPRVAVAPRVLRQQIPRPRQRQRRRLLTGEQKRRDLDAELLVGHRLAGLLVARRHQHGEQVGAVGRGASALADDVIDRAAEHRVRAPRTAGASALAAVGEAERPEALADVLIDDRPGLIDRSRNGPRSAPSSARRTTVRVRRIISSPTSTGRPAEASVSHRAAVSRAAIGHGAGQRRDALAMKRRLRDAPLPQPEVVLARQQAVAERHPQFVVERALVIVARVVLQDVTHVRGVGNEVAASRADLEIGDVAEAMCGSSGTRRSDLRLTAGSMPRTGNPRGPGGSVADS